ncbi:hypothetical protein [Bythopirellula goksoeyrii]|uniref:Uncharacterized protein n=1 Tax=Bythopirellula goksoeyrii TaxID=1400387 RepID=A0A5B9Q572_9BACT|nr:hypothetical protein [Bythopirellula goksoeyrii]QEG34188.1 hypothetical protein Pr1d_14610 [Bythopirellula goksoeyrii]
MQDNDFLLIYPLYLIGSMDGAALTLSGEHSGDRGVAVFTEELLAERVQEQLQFDSEIWTIETPEQLKNHHVPLCKELGINYFAIDPKHETGEAFFIPIDGIE